MKYSCIPALFMLVLSSCGKENSIEKPTIKIDPIPQFSMSAAKFNNSATLFLKKEVSFTSNRPSLKNIKLFTYDGDMRCTEIKLGTIDSSASNPVFNLKQTLTFQYEAANSLLPASVSSVRTVFPNLTTTFYYKYNAEGRKIMDSVRVKNQLGEPADRVVNYTYVYDKVYATPQFKGFPIENNSYDTLSLLTAGNIENLVSNYIRSTGNERVTYSFTYDQFVSPYNKLNIANSLYFESASLGLGYNVPLETHYMGVTTNNMTSWTTDGYMVQFKYLYNQSKYPVKKEMFLPGDVNPSQTTFFEY